MNFSYLLPLAALSLVTACSNDTASNSVPDAETYCYVYESQGGYDECGPIPGDYQNLLSQCGSGGTSGYVCPEAGVLGTCTLTLQQSGFWNGAVAFYADYDDAGADASAETICLQDNPGATWTPAH
jgi:hypothetical protein